VRSALLGVLLALLAPAVAGAAGWSTPVAVSSASTFVDAPFMGFWSSGQGLAAWRWADGTGPRRRSGERVAARGADGTFARERRVPDAAVAPVVFGRAGVAIVSRSTRVVRRGGAATETARLHVWLGGIAGALVRTWSSPVHRPTGSPALAVNSRGDVAIAWVRVKPGGRRELLLAERKPGRVFSGPTVVARGRPDAVAVAVGRRGNLVVAWAADGAVFARTRRGLARRLEPVVRLGAGARLHTRLRAAVSPGGRAWVAWASQRLSEGGDNGPFVLRAASGRAGGRLFTRPVMLERFRRRASDEGSFDLALDPEGRAFVAWAGWDGAHFRARLAELAALDGRLLVRASVSSPGYDAVVADVAASRRAGEALVVWARLDALGELGTEVLAAHRAPSGATESEEVVSSGDRARLPAAAFDPRTGLPTVVWSQREGPDGPGVPLSQVRTVLRASTRSA
jgi:hypothetical protein